MDPHVEPPVCTHRENYVCYVRADAVVVTFVIEPGRHGLRLTQIARTSL
jgi:hypothetical protein